MNSLTKSMVLGISFLFIAPSQVTFAEGRKAARTTCRNPGKIEDMSDVLLNVREYSKINDVYGHPVTDMGAESRIRFVNFYMSEDGKEMLRDGALARTYKKSDVSKSVDECNGYTIGGMYNGGKIQMIFSDGTLLVDHRLMKPEAAIQTSFQRGEEVLFQAGSERFYSRLVKVKGTSGSYVFVETEARFAYKEFIYVKEGILPDMDKVDQNEMVVMKVPASRLQKRVKCVEKYCVDSIIPGDSILLEKNSKLRLKILFPNGIMYAEMLDQHEKLLANGLKRIAFNGTYFRNY